ncbi:MAG TPA: glycosyltransferase family 2 protein [Thermoanaerobaculia bacterium]|nr:glycosyltransferase family 2 protein [Thermoanaerobaculia bacterium]
MPTLSERALPQLSVLVVVFDMEREAHRTLRSLADDYQRGVSAEQYEVLVLDNGSPEPFHAGSVAEYGPNFHYHRMPQPSRSPAGAINYGARLATADYLGVMIDGARLLTPGILRYALAARRLVAEPYVVTHCFDLGPALQPIAIEQGYDREREDALLASIGWPADGQRLFDVGVTAADGWFAPLLESTLVFVTRRTFEGVGGFDERFTSAGGGMVNIHMHERFCAQPEVELVTLLGEATFHQMHGGAATGVPQSAQAELTEALREDYRSIVGAPWSGRPPARPSRFLGHLPPPARRWLAHRRDELAAELTRVRRTVRLLESATSDRQREMLHVHGMIADRDAELARLREELAARIATANWLADEVAARRATLSRLEREVAEPQSALVEGEPCAPAVSAPPAVPN